MSSGHGTITAPWKLSCEQLCIERGGRMVLHDLGIEISNGECVSLIGPNGSGKTTLMLSMLGLLRPASGIVRINGRDVSRLPARTRGRFASYVPQMVDRVPGFSVRDVVAGGRFPHVDPMRPLSSSDHQAVEQALDLCGLMQLADRPINAISGGERQKALIAAAIAQDAQLMALDEPNTALDPAYQIDLVRLLRHWHDAGRALLSISHDLQLPAALGGRVIALRDGHVVADGPAGKILCPAKLSEIYNAEFVIARRPDGSETVLPNWEESGVRTAR